MGVTIGSDARFGVNSGGNLTLGKQFQDAPVGANHDGQQDTTYTWLKKDAYFQVPLDALTLVGSGATYTRDAQGQFSISLPTAATTYRLAIPCNHILNRIFTSVPHGFLLKDIMLWYSIGAVDLTAHTFTLNQETMAGAAARAAATAFGGTLTVSNDGAAAGAISTLPVTQRANLYLSQVLLGTPAFANVDNKLVTAEWTLATGAATGTAKVHGVAFHGSIGLY